MIYGKTLRDGISDETVREMTGCGEYGGVLEKVEIVRLWTGEKNG